MQSLPSEISLYRKSSLQNLKKLRMNYKISLENQTDFSLLFEKVGYFSNLPRNLSLQSREE